MQELQKQLLGLVQEAFPEAMYPAAMCALADLREVGCNRLQAGILAMGHTCAEHGLFWECADVVTAPLLWLSCADPSEDQLYMVLQIDEQDMLDRLVGDGAAGKAAALCQKGNSDGAEVRRKPTSVCY